MRWRAIGSILRHVVDLANDAGRRRALRFELRERMRSRIADFAQHARELGDALREAWRSWCAGEAQGRRDGRI